MNFSTEIDLGNVLTILSFLVTLYTMHKANLKRIAHIEFKVGLMWKRFARQFDLPEDLGDEKGLSDS